tara:strand:- start:591 stop:1286 length:696 start_codon:yes stop_codon:yes gene_type:complete
MLVLIQARMNSKRLPKKVLFKINNQEILKHMFSRILKCKNKVNLVVATSEKKIDNAIIKLCKREKVKFFRGSQENVALRLIKCAEKFKSTYFIRLCGDSPLIDPNIIDKMINLFKKKGGLDLISNRQDTSIPPGQTVEIIKINSLKQAYKSFKKKSHYEHVTSFFYENKKKFNIFTTSLKKKKSKIKLTLDTKKDLIKLKRIILSFKDNKNYNLSRIEKKYQELGYVKKNN